MSPLPHCPMPGRASALLATAATTAVVALAGPVGTASADVTVVGPTATLRVGSYNIQANRSPEEFAAAVAKVLPGADVIGLQEVNGLDKATKLVQLAPAGWFTYRPQGGGGQEPILWRSGRFDLLSHDVVRLTPRTYIGDEKPPETVQEEKYVTVVRLHDKVTGADQSFIDVHLVSGAVKGGTFRPGRPRLEALYLAQTTALAALVETESERAPTYVLGDFNSGYLADNRDRHAGLPVVTLGAVGLTSMWATGLPTKGGTRGSAFLDQVYAAAAPVATKVGYKITDSDHHPIWSTYAIPIRSQDPPVDPPGPLTPAPAG